MKFGEKLKIQRDKKGLSQNELAKELGDITSRTLRNYERGASHPQDRNVYFKLANYFGVDVNYFLTENEEFLAKAAESYGKTGVDQAKVLLEGAAALFAGGELSDEDKLGFLHDLQSAYFMAKDTAKEKYTSRKHKNL